VSVFLKAPIPHALGCIVLGRTPARHQWSLRSEGTQNLVSAAVAVGARRLVAQSIAWVYAPGAEPHAETDPLDAADEGESGINMQGVIALEDLTLKSPPLQGVVLRYGHLYGPGTPFDQPSSSTPVHVDAAAYAALLSIDHGEPGIYNIVQPNRIVATKTARAELGWTPDFVFRLDELTSIQRPSPGDSKRNRK
jgi:nucleoside-diphosphate-sugar epimerase